MMDALFDSRTSDGFLPGQASADKAGRALESAQSSGQSWVIYEVLTGNTLYEMSRESVARDFAKPMGKKWAVAKATANHQQKGS